MTDKAEKHAEEPTTALASPPVATDDPAPTPVERHPVDEVVDLFLKRPLYAKIEGDAEFIKAVEAVFEGTTVANYDSYCRECDQITPWTVRRVIPRISGGGTPGISARYTDPVPPSIRAVNAVCLRRQNHVQTYIVHVKGLTVQKIGQRPSMGDLAHGELRAIPGIQKQDRTELGRALGLFAHDTPLGAFVYLRRVFERMITRAHERHIEKHGGPLENWKDLKMGERTGALADELPSVVNTNAAVWGLLSKGLHELTDEDAATLFPLVKAVILEMLGEEERHRQSAIQKEATRRALAEAATRFNK